MRTRASLRLMIAVCALLVGCADDLTQIVVVVDSDLNTPSEVDNLTLNATDSSTIIRAASATLGGVDDARFPLTVALLPGADIESPVTVTVSAKHGSSTIVAGEAETHFVRGKSLMLRILLARECINDGAAHCAAGTTCRVTGTNASCVSSAVDPNTLSLWTGSIPAFDASVGGDMMSLADSSNTSDATSFTGDASDAMDSGTLPDFGPGTCAVSSQCVHSTDLHNCTYGICNTATHMCSESLAVDCDDADPCTTDECTGEPHNQCSHLPITMCP